MNADQFNGKWMQFKGDLKKEYGKFTDDDLQQIEGNYDKFLGKLRERYGDEKQDAGHKIVNWADEWYRKFESAVGIGSKT